MISRTELQILANREKVALGILGKDYVMTEVLKALSKVPELQDLLVFKGGTALGKIYFPDWRYSEDLDFTVKKDMKEDLGYFLTLFSFPRIGQSNPVQCFGQNPDLAQTE